MFPNYYHLPYIPLLIMFNSQIMFIISYKTEMKYESQDYSKPLSDYKSNTLIQRVTTRHFIMINRYSS